jgi:CheY-like chemotaxis protein
MFHSHARLLIVDDEQPIRELMSQSLIDIGYQVRCAENGFEGLRKIRNGMPDILVSDLNMPNMSGYEFLSVVRRRFPAIAVIAMSGAFTGDEVPFGVAADAFYPKSANIGALLKVMQALPPQESIQLNHQRMTPTLWIQPNGCDSAGEKYVTIVCPECFRSYPQPLDRASQRIRETSCLFCSTYILYAIVEPIAKTPVLAYQRLPALNGLHATAATKYFSNL